MKYCTSRKTLALGMTLLFLGTIFVPVVSGDAGSSEPSLGNKVSSNTAGESSRTGFSGFVYGPLGNRISSTDAEGNTDFYLYEGVGVIQDRMSDGTLAREYVSGVGGKLAMIDHTDDGNKLAGEVEVLYYLHDILGSVVLLINSGGEVVERYYYSPYGETNITDRLGTSERSESLFGNTFMWTGKQYDAENKLYHFPARSYSSTLGRWLQRDPLGYVDGLNLYEYVRSNPINFVDPLGLEGGPSDFFWMRQQVYEHSEEAGKAFDEGATKFSMCVTLAVGGGAICARLGLITTSLFVGECAVDETISYYHGPDAAIFADTMMGGPGLYSAKEMAEQGIRGQLQSIRRQLGRFLDKITEWQMRRGTVLGMNALGGLGGGNLNPYKIFPPISRGPFVLDSGAMQTIHRNRGFIVAKAFRNNNRGRLYITEMTSRELRNRPYGIMMSELDIKVIPNSEICEETVKETIQQLRRLRISINNARAANLLTASKNSGFNLLTTDNDLLKAALMLEHHDVSWILWKAIPKRIRYSSYCNVEASIRKYAPGMDPNIFVGEYRPSGFVSRFFP